MLANIPGWTSCRSLPGVVWTVAACLAVAAIGRLAPAAEDKPPSTEKARTDVQGDPLPEGALARFGTLRWRHGGPVAFVAYTQEGKALITASTDGTVRLWERETGKELRRFSQPTEPVKSPTTVEEARAAAALVRLGAGRGAAPGVALSQDGKTLAVVTGLAVQLWDVATGKELQKIAGPQNGLSLPVFSPDGKLLAARGGDQIIYLYDASTGKETRKIEKENTGSGGVFFGGRGTGPTLGFSTDGKLLASTELDIVDRRVVGSIRLLAVETGKEVRKVKLEQASSPPFAFSPNGKILAYATGNALRLTEADSDKVIRELKIAQPGASGVFFSPDGKLLAVKGLLDEVVRLWDVEAGTELRQLGERAPAAAGAAGGFIVSSIGGMQGAARDIAFSPDGKTVALGGNTNTVRFHDVTTGKEVAQNAGHRGPATAVVVAADGKTLLSHGADNTIRRWDAATGKELGQFTTPAGTTWLAFAPDGKTVALGNTDRSVRLLDAVTSKELHKFTGHTNGATILAFSPDGKTLASRGNGDNTIRLYDTATGKDLRQLALQAESAAPGGVATIRIGGGGFGGAGAGLAFSPDGKTLIAQGITGATSPVVANPAGGMAVRNTLNLWDVTTGKELSKLTLPQQRAVSSFTFSPDGRTLATENTDQTVTLWELASSNERATLGTASPARTANTSTGVVMVAGGAAIYGGSAAAGPTIAFSPDGRMLAVKESKQVRLWDVRAAKELKPLVGHQGDIAALTFAPDGKSLVSASQDTTLLSWNVGGLTTGSKLTTGGLPPAEIEALWTDLGGSDASRAYQSIQKLAASPKEAAALLKVRLKATVPVDQKLLERWLANLESDEFAARKQASEELEKLGDLAVPALTKVLANKPPLETAKRVEELLGKLTGGSLSGEPLRLVRAVEVLELVGTPEARQVLETLAKGAPGALATRESQAALERLARQTSARP